MDRSPDNLTLVTDRLTFGPLAALDDEARGRLEASATPLELQSGGTLIREGDSADAAYVLLSGRVKVLIGEKLVTVGVVAAPALVGEIAVLDGQPRMATVVASEPAELLRIPSDVFRSVVDEHPAVAAELRAFADARLARTLLQRNSPFADLPSGSLAELSAKMRAARFAPGEVILREGEIGDDTYLIRSGEISVVRGEGDDERQLIVLGPGTFIGEVSVLTGVPRTATVRAKTDVTAFRIAGDDVRPVVKAHRALVERLESTMQSRHAPRRVENVEVAPAPDDRTAVILHDRVRGAYLRLNADSYAIYQDLDGERSLRDLALAHFARTGTLDPHGVLSTIATLQAAGFASAPHVAGEEQRRRPIQRIADLVLQPHYEIADADPLAARLHHAFGWLFGRAGVAAAMAVGIVGLVAFAFEFRGLPNDLGLVGLAIAFGGLFVAGLGHEAAHAIATKATGRRIGRAGLGLVFFTPVIYVDTSDAWLIDRRRRVFVNAAGPVFNFALAGILALAAGLATGDARSVLLWLAAVNLVSVVFNLSPLLEFDGYYVLSDIANVTRLRRRALRFVFGDLAGRPRLPRTRLETGFVAYAMAAVLYVVGVTGLVLAGVPNLVNGILAGRFDPTIRLVAGASVALFLIYSLVSPFVNEVRSARASAAAS